MLNSKVIYRTGQVQNNFRLRVQEGEENYIVTELHPSRTAKIRSLNTGKTYSVSLDNLRLISNEDSNEEACQTLKRQS